jgi:hypothetical protein
MPNLPTPDFNALLDTRGRIEAVLEPYEDELGISARMIADAWLRDALRIQAHQTGLADEASEPPLPEHRTRAVVRAASVAGLGPATIVLQRQQRIVYLMVSTARGRASVALREVELRRFSFTVGQMLLQVATGDYPVIAGPDRPALCLVPRQGHQRPENGA